MKGEVDELKSSSQEALRSLMDGVRARLLWVEDVVNGILSSFEMLGEAWLVHEDLPPKIL
ncbi:hypothetical protein apy_14490 [Aeropyrum pernix]|uniref:Uncharacterized protein n=1 Tax=Aeropyrum pernix TaxID=56636 RepID=A0A401HBD6_AERPX|nr:hypothetical protein [Aeropyrum pernix]GBF09724.1 hypothetical protein apy_14490 [Aeropyrum pernix]